MHKFNFGFLLQFKFCGFAIRQGYRHIDGAHIYLNEAEVGEVYKELISAGEIKREELFIASKVIN